MGGDLYGVVLDLRRGACAFAYNKSTKSETQIGARGFVAVEVMWQLGVWLILGFFHRPRPCLVALYQCRKACQTDA